MRRGEVALVTVRADYAYGVKGALPSIPPDSTLQYQVELVVWREAGPGGGKAAAAMSAEERVASAEASKAQARRFFDGGEWQVRAARRAETRRAPR